KLQLRPDPFRLQNAFLARQFGKLASIPFVHLHVVREQSRHSGRRKASDPRLQQSRRVTPNSAYTKIRKRSHERRLILAPDTFQGNCLKLRSLPRRRSKRPIVRVPLVDSHRRQLQEITGRNHLASAKRLIPSAQPPKK